MRRESFHELSDAEQAVVLEAGRIERGVRRKERKQAKTRKRERTKEHNLQVAREALREVQSRFRQPRVEDAPYLSWVRRACCLVCAIRGEVQVLRTDPAHVRRDYPEPGWRPVGGAETPSDFRCIPLCRTHHDEQHAHDNHGWYADLGIYPPSVCAELKTAQEAGADPVESVTAIAYAIRGQK